MENNYNNLKIAFKKMIEAGWNIDKDLKWQYFFFNRNFLNLKKLSLKLLKSGYNLEYLGKTEDGQEYVLILSKIEILSIEDLFNKNVFLNKIVSSFEIDSYDGWDVERI